MSIGRSRRTYALIFWLLANSIAGLAWGFTLRLGLGCGMGGLNLEPLGCLWIQLGPQLTIPMAVLQFAVLRRTLSVSYWWIPVTAAAGLLLFPTVYGTVRGLLSMGRLVPRDLAEIVLIISPVSGALIAGSAVGLLQMRLIPRPWPARRRWILASGLGAALSLPLRLIAEPGPMIAACCTHCPRGRSSTDGRTERWAWDQWQLR
jgi:hypothetical protein